jgi:hypothetical protein
VVNCPAGIETGHPGMVEQFAQFFDQGLAEHDGGNDQNRDDHQ